jgi:hypothetical protein
MRFGVVLEGDGYDLIAIAAGSIDGKLRQAWLSADTVDERSILLRLLARRGKL